MVLTGRKRAFLAIAPRNGNTCHLKQAVVGVLLIALSNESIGLEITENG